MVCYKFANKLFFFANLLFLQFLLVAFGQIECLCFLQYIFFFLPADFTNGFNLGGIHEISVGVSLAFQGLKGPSI